MPSVRDIAYVRYQATDLDQMEAFLVDFGMHRVDRKDASLHMRTYGSVPFAHVTELGDVNRPMGVGFVVDSERALAEFAECVGEPIEESSEPGGGRRVRSKDPSGFLVDVHFGQQLPAALPRRAALPMNIDSTHARLGQTVRLKSSPAHVLRLGHVALLVRDYASSVAFYRDALGMKPSDVYYVGPESNEVAAFMHCGLGETWTDHHTIAIVQSNDGQARFDHSAFEVVDLDDLMQGGEYLKSKNYVHSWGVGRHVQGSQIFDYWRDPFGNKIEHWTDGDQVNDQTPVSRVQISPDSLSQWAPPLQPELFFS